METRMSVPNFRSMHSAVIKTWMSTVCWWKRKSLAITKVIQFHRWGPWVSFHGKSLQQLRYFSLEQTMLKITLNSVIFVNRSVNTTLSLTLVVAVVVLLISVELLLSYICSIISGPCPCVISGLSYTLLGLGGVCVSLLCQGGGFSH